jgi:hypothetical protein
MKFQYPDKLKLQLTFKYLLNLAVIAGITTIFSSEVYAVGATPKFFICPQGMIRFATLVTTKHEINLCGKEGKDPTVLAQRLKGTKKVVNIPIISNKHPLHTAHGNDGTVYTIDYKKLVLTIQPKKGKLLTEKITASD